ncbi:MAG: lipid IV(A) 3-deoxy-D-manno-octulosonic acid transferase [Thiobacillus sp.]|nr:lipid IV(A) 3-deoxy-D-manno-octulosonic acid transferase [Thiobacillus sp.]
MTRFLYTLAIFALLPWAMLHLLWRARRQPEYLQHWGERFGFYGDLTAAAVPHAGHFIPATGHSVPPTPTFKTFWIHAVSVGETRAAQPLIAALRERFPACRILLTHMTPTGRAASVALFGDSVERVYLPYDTPGAMRRFLRHFRPTLGLIMETELWPNLIDACHAQGLPLLLVNARLSEKSARRYARFPRLARQALEQLSAISAIGEDDALRLRALGAAAVTVTGNMKFDMTPPAEQLEIGAMLRGRIGTRPVFLCASTREGEEALILDAWQAKVGAGDTAQCATLLVIVPRHPQRFDAVAQHVRQCGLKMQRRSDDAPVAADTQVWLGDSMGEMFAYYAAADVAFVGGSLLDFGCQNLIEPCAVGVPVLIGPSTFNFAEAARAALAAGAARQIGNAAGLVEQAQTIMADEACKQAMGDAGRAFAARHRGATRRTMALIPPREGEEEGRAFS